METGRPSTRSPSEPSSGATDIQPNHPANIVVVDRRSAAPVGNAEHVSVRASDAAMFKAEQQAPDGAGPRPHERRVTPWVIAILALSGLFLVGFGMFVAGGVQAMAVGLAWMLAGYAVAWIVVWAASLARARDEKEIEEAIIIQNLSDIRPQDSIRVN